MIGPVVLRIPNDRQMSRVARLAASGVASLGGFDVEAIEDIKIAVSETVLALIEQGDSTGDIELRIEIETDPLTFTVEGSTAAMENSLATADLDLCRAVLSGVSSAYSIEQVDGRSQIRVILGGGVG